MAVNSRILVVLDSSPLAETALQRSLLIAQKTGASLDLMWRESVLPDRPIMQIVAKIIVSGIAVEQHYSNASKLLDEIEACWQTRQQMLIIKGCDESHRDFWTPLDWQLLRRMPCPVLLVKHDMSWQQGTILAAVDPTAQLADDHLSHDVLRLGSFIAHQAQAHCRVVGAYPPPILSSDAQSQSATTLGANAEQMISATLAKLSLASTAPLIGEGPPEYWIPAAAQQEQAKLVVIGTHGREGIAGALLGNTAERILDRLSCDVLVIKAAHTQGIAALINQDA